MRNKKVVITGGTGFVGANLVRKLVGLGYSPTLLIRKKSNLWRLKDIVSKVNLVKTDLLNYSLLKKDMSKIKPDYIYHLAVYGANQSTQRDTQELVRFNILGTLNLLSVCCDYGFKYFINTGSSSEYGIKNQPMKEDDLLQPSNFYGVTKSSVTHMASIFSKTHHLPLVTLRIFSPYGYFEDKMRFMATIMINAVKNKDIQLSNPNYVRDFIFIDDLLNAYIYFLNGKNYYGEIFNIGSGEQTKIGEVVKLVESISKKKLKVKWSIHKSNQVEPKIWQADIHKAKSEFNWQPTINLVDGLKLTYNWFLRNINLYD